MRVLTLLFTVTLGLLCGCVSPSAPQADHYYRAVSFPRVALAEGERIESFEVVISCARFSAIHHIPNDWSVEVVSPVSEVSTLKAAAGHGSTALWSSRELDGFITILVCEPSCFTIKGTATLFTTDKERTVSFTQSDFVMKPSPNTALEPTGVGALSSAARSTSRVAGGSAFGR